MFRFLRRAYWDRERAREMDAHLAHHVDELIAGGLPPDEARRKARAEFGNPTLIREEIYAMNSVPILETIARDARYAARVLRRSPAFTLTAVLTLAVAIAINTAVFSLVDGVLLRPLPFPAPQRLGLVETTVQRDGEVRPMTSQHGITWAVVRDHATVVERAVFSTWTSGLNVLDGNRPSYADQQRVGAGYFGVLGVPPALGREFTPDEDRPGGPWAVILSHDYWRTAMAADPGVVGRTITLRGEPHVVVGIMPAGFHSGIDADLWTPLRATTTGEGEGENYQILLRLRDGATWEQADAELARLGREVLRQRPRADGTAIAFSTVPLQQGTTRDLRPALILVWSAVAIVLVVACVNLAGLLLARGARRTREIATRLALGAGRAAVVRQLVVESVVLGLVGALAGLGLAAVVLDGVRAGLDMLGIWQPVQLDWRAGGVALMLGLLSSVGFGLLPAMHGARLDVHQGLAGTGTRTVAGAASHWPRRLLVVAQVALGVVLLVGAGLLVRTFTYLRGLEPGFSASGVTAATVSLQDARYRTAADVRRLVDTTLRHLEGTRGIHAAAVSLGLPYERLLNLGFRHLDGPEAADPRGRMTSATYVAGEYFRAFQIPIRAGRTFTDRDTATSPAVVIVNEAFAQEYFRGASAVGRRIAFAGAERDIVGIVGNVQVRPGFGDAGPLAAMPLAYIPLAQANDGFLRLVHGWFTPSFIVRSNERAASDILPVVRSALDAADPLLPVAKLRSLREVQDAALAQPRLFMTVLLTLALATALLAAIGLHGLIAASVNERTREMGIRLALGATTWHAVRTLALPGILLAAAGTIIGVMVARAAVSMLQSFVWGVSPTDPATFAGVAASFVLVAAVASLLPALRVLRLDPARTLREE